jgi:hypothetical protein
MPKLNTLQIEDRIVEYNRRIREGEEIAIRDIKVILTWVDGGLIQWMDNEWEQQLQLRKQKRARTEEEKSALGYKTKRDIQIEALEKAREKICEELLEKFEKEIAEKEYRQARVLLDGFEKAKRANKSFESAFAFANNELTRANLPRVDGIKVSTDSRRDKEVWAMEDGLKAKFREEMTDDEREQQDLLAEVNGEIGKKTKKKAKK